MPGLVVSFSRCLCWSCRLLRLLMCLAEGLKNCDAFITHIRINYVFISPARDGQRMLTFFFFSFSTVVLFFLVPPSQHSSQRQVSLPFATEPFVPYSSPPVLPAATSGAPPRQTPWSPRLLHPPFMSYGVRPFGRTFRFFRGLALLLACARAAEGTGHSPEGSPEVHGHHGPLRQEGAFLASS